MRNLKQIMLFVMVGALLTFNSCSSSDDGGDGGSAAPGTLSAKIDGASMTSVKIATFATLSNGNLQIQGNTGGTSSKAIIMYIMGFDGVGTYPIGGGANIFNWASYVETVVDLSNPTAPDVKTWQAPFDDTQVGEIKISEVTDTNIQGTFSFSAKTEGENTKSVTEGSFNIDFN